MSFKGYIRLFSAYTLCLPIYLLCEEKDIPSLTKKVLYQASLTMMYSTPWNMRQNRAMVKIGQMFCHRDKKNNKLV